MAIEMARALDAGLLAFMVFTTGARQAGAPRPMIDTAALVGLELDARAALEVAEAAHRETERAEAAGQDAAEYRAFELTAIGEAMRTRDKFLSALAHEVLAKTRHEAHQRKVQARREAEERAAAVAAGKAVGIWSKAPSAPPVHPYLVAKGIQAHGLRVDRHGNLVVPARDISGTLHTLQLIGPDGAKKFLRGGATAGHFHLVGKPDPTGVLLIAEGFATAASLHEDSEYPVAVAFSATNLLRVASALRMRYPEAVLVVAADADPVGVAKAREAALAVGARLLIPDFSRVPGRLPGHTDFNDLAALLAASEVPT